MYFMHSPKVKKHLPRNYSTSFDLRVKDSLQLLFIFINMFSFGGHGIILNSCVCVVPSNESYFISNGSLKIPTFSYLTGSMIICVQSLTISNISCEQNLRYCYCKMQGDKAITTRCL